MNTAQGPTSLSVQSSANLSNYIGASSNTASPKNSRPNGGRSQKRNPEAAGLESSPGSVEDANEGGNSDDRKRQPGVKRACNECRQQKVSQPAWMLSLRCWPAVMLIASLNSYDVTSFRNPSTKPAGGVGA